MKTTILPRPDNTYRTQEEWINFFCDGDNKVDICKMMLRMYDEYSIKELKNVIEDSKKMKFKDFIEKY